MKPANRSKKKGEKINEQNNTAKKFHARESNPGALACKGFFLPTALRQQTWKGEVKLLYLKLFLCEVFPLDAVICLVT